MQRIKKLEINTLGYVVYEILSQNQNLEWEVLAHYSQKKIHAKSNYEIYKAELLIIIASCYHGRDHLEQLFYTLEVIIDHSNLRSFITTNKLIQ